MGRHLVLNKIENVSILTVQKPEVRYYVNRYALIVNLS